MDVEERLERLENLLTLVVDKLRRIEAILGEGAPEAELLHVSLSLVSALSMPASTALEAARRSIATLRSLGRIDPISRTVIEALSGCEALTISEVTRRVRALRGTASRRIIRERLLLLEERGAVTRKEGSGHPRFVLRRCLYEEEAGQEG